MSMTKIATVTVGAGGASSIDFTSIPGTFTDLMVVVSTRSDGSYTTNGSAIQFNGSTTGYSERVLYGTGSAAASASRSGSSFLWSILTYGTSTTANTYGSSNIYIPNYAGSTSKSISSDAVAEWNNSAADQYMNAGLWANSAAITSIKLTPTIGNFTQYSTATLYGITKGSLAGVTVS